MDNIISLESNKESSNPIKTDKNILNSVDLLNQENLPSPTGGSNSNWSTQGGPSKSSKVNKFFSRKKLIIGGGIIGGGTIATFFIFSILSGPFQFIHIAELLRKFHYEAQSIAQDERFARQVRLFATGRAERTRMGFLGNKFADSFESKIGKTGFKSAYSNKFGLFDGLVIDKTNPKFKGMSDAEIKKFVKDTYGVEVKSPSEIKGSSAKLRSITDALMVDGRSLSAVDSYKLNHALLKEAGLGNISSAIGSRFMCVRAGCGFSPLTKLNKNIKSSIEEWNNKRKANLSDGQTNSSADNKPKAKDANSPPSTATDITNQGNVDSTISETNSGASSVKSGTSSFDTFKGSVAGKFTGAAGAVLAIVCIMQAINKNIDSLKQTQVITPLIKMGVESLAVGSQIKSGNNVNLDELSAMSAQLSGKDSSGKVSSWSQSQSIQTNLGNPNTGVAPNSTLKSIGGNANPFDFLKSIGDALDVACGAIVQGILMVFTFATDLTGIGFIVNTVTTLVTSKLSGPVIDTVSHWMAGSAVDVAAIGADYGNAIDYGTTLASNQQYLMAGGSQLTTAQVAANNQVVNSISQKEFSQQPVYAQLFNLSDSRSIISKMADNLSPSYKATFANMFSYVLGSGKNAISGVASLFSTKTLAASNTPYDYGFNIIGYSQQDAINPAVTDPYSNADYVVNNLVTNQNLLDKAKKCFGVNISQDSNLNWNVTSDSSASNLNPYTKEYQGYGCNMTAPADCSSNSSDACNWLRLRYFITDTETMNSMGCYAGETQACTDSGL